jgi:hypothetical protein
LKAAGALAISGGVGVAYANMSRLSHLAGIAAEGFSPGVDKRHTVCVAAVFS